MGTTYEAFHSRQILFRLVKERRVTSVCEYPICTFRVPGIMSAYLAALGCEVTLATTDEPTLKKSRELFDAWRVAERARFVRIGINHLDSEGFDMVFHMSLLPTIERDLSIEPLSCFGEMTRLSKRWVFDTNHNLHYSILLDRILSRATGTPTQFGDSRLVGAKPLRQIFQKVGLVIRDEFPFNIPPWPALDISKLFSRIRRHTTKRMVSSTSRTIEQTMRKYSFIETSAIPKQIKTIFAYHIAIVGEKGCMLA